MMLHEVQIERVDHAWLIHQTFCLGVADDGLLVTHRSTAAFLGEAAAVLELTRLLPLIRKKWELGEQE